MKKKGEGVHWKQMGELVLFGVILIVLFSCFPKATSQGIEVAGYLGLAAVVLIMVYAGYLNWKLTRYRDSKDQIEHESHGFEAQPQKPDRHPPKSHRHFTFEISTYALLGVIALIHLQLKNHGALTPQKNSLFGAMVACIAAVFCACNLFWGIRNQRTWLRWFSDISRRESPCNYWVAICGWTIFTSGFLGAFILECIKLVSG